MSRCEICGKGKGEHTLVSACCNANLGDPHVQGGPGIYGMFACSKCGKQCFPANGTGKDDLSNCVRCPNWQKLIDERPVLLAKNSAKMESDLNHIHEVLSEPKMEDFFA